MKKYLWIFIFFIIVTIGVSIYFNKTNTNNNEETYIAERTSLEVKDNNEIQSLEQEVDENQQEITEQPTELSEFSTELPKDTQERYSNINLACQTLNGTRIKSGETFSLWNVLGCPTKEKGYGKAKTFTSGGKVTQSYGGGICQVSTTIYNAVIAVQGLEVVERHEHSRDVVYIEDGKDAAVSYNSADLKFKNTLDYDVELDAKLENNKVIINLIRI